MYFSKELCRLSLLSRRYDSACRCVCIVFMDIQQLHRRFYDEYLSSLQKQYKDLCQCGFENKMEVGDIVLIKNPAKSRPYWPLVRMLMNYSQIQICEMDIDCSYIYIYIYIEHKNLETQKTLLSSSTKLFNTFEFKGSST